jgi:hypothetical protein
MSLSSETMMRLMEYADGELAADGRAEIEALLLKDPDAARFVRDVAGLGEITRALHEASPDAKRIASFDVADMVMAAVKEAKRDPPVAKKVVSLADARAKRSNMAMRIGGGVVAVAALAASIFLFARPQGESPLGSGPYAQTTGPVATNQTAFPTTGVEVSTVDSPSNVSVLYLPSGKDMSTSVVVWVDETGEQQ